MRLRTVMLFALIATIALGGCIRRSGEPGSKSNPVRFYFMPLKGNEAFAKNAAIIKKYIEDNAGLSVKTINAPDFVTIVNAFGNGQADIAFMNTLGYLMARDWAKAEAHLLMLYGDVYRGYRGEIIVKADGGINAPTDLAGKTIAFSDPFSASGYLYAFKFLRDHNIKPAKTVFAGSHRKAVEMVYNGEVDAAATYHERPAVSGEDRDARIELLAEHPDIVSKIKIVALTDEIPNGPVALRKDLPAEVKSKLVGALMEFARTAEGRKTLNDLYNVTGLALVNDSDYDGVQKVVKELGKNIEETVPGGVTFYKKKIGPLLEN